MERITGKTNDHIKHAVRLRESAAARREQGLFFLEGARLCADAAAGGVAVTECFVTDAAREKYAAYLTDLFAAAQRVYAVTDEVAEKLADTKNSQGVFCVCKMLDKMTNIGKIIYTGKYVALENVSNPQNLGAAVRTAEALGLDGAVVGGGCDRYNPKAQRAAMGSLLRFPIFETDDLPAFLSQLQGQGMKAYAAVPDRAATPVTAADLSGGVIVAVGNEGSGLSPATEAVCQKLTIPMKGRAESLNAASAASILMWELMR
ncbi:MAG: RNA methyltransferase [Clostridia bacterium]|nr:RNA methyltransferase [Clostridia bacterium]